MIRRIINQTIRNRVNKGKAIILLGPRQVGKTTLINEFLSNQDFLFLNGDDRDVQELLENTGTSKLKAIIGSVTPLTVTMTGNAGIRIMDLCAHLRASLLFDHLPIVPALRKHSSSFALRPWLLRAASNFRKRFCFTATAHIPASSQ